MYSPFLIHQNLEFSHHCRTHKKISNLSTNSIFKIPIVLTLNTLQCVAYYLNIKLAKFFHKNDVGKSATPFRIRLKPNAQLLTQRHSEVSIHYRDELNNLLKEVEKHNIIKQIGSSSEDKANYGTVYSNRMSIIPNGHSIKCVLDARHLYPIPEQSDELWLIEPLAPQLARANKKYKCAIDLMYPYAHTPLDYETIKHTSVS